MYLRWWIVEQIVNIMGKGFFKDDFPIIGTRLAYMYVCMYVCTYLYFFSYHVYYYVMHIYAC
jgi:hypothetical protein